VVVVNFETKADGRDSNIIGDLIQSNLAISINTSSNNDISSLSVLIITHMKNTIL
jgi:hypothetical protein